MGVAVEQLELAGVALELRCAGAIADRQPLQLARRGLVTGALQAAGGLVAGGCLVVAQFHLVEVPAGGTGSTGIARRASSRERLGADIEELRLVPLQPGAGRRQAASEDLPMT